MGSFTHFLGFLFAVIAMAAFADSLSVFLLYTTGSENVMANFTGPLMNVCLIVNGFSVKYPYRQFSLGPCRLSDQQAYLAEQIQHHERCHQVVWRHQPSARRL